MDGYRVGRHTAVAASLTHYGTRPFHHVDDEPRRI